MLITNNALATRGGSETYVRDVALGLLKRGHVPTIYSTQLGDVAQELQKATVAVVEDLNQLGSAPDLIHGHHHMETMTALLHFPRVPAINFCHGWKHWHETPIRFPRILRYVAVDHACRDRLLHHGIPEERIRVLFNSVDLDRFKMREAPLPPRPKRALVFSNYANEQTHLPVVREACLRTNLELEVVGSGKNNSTAEPERILGEYDLVFAKARCALEALAVGTPVILCDASGLGPMVTNDELDYLRPLNFGFRALREPLDAGRIAEEINRYDRADALEVCRKVRATAGLDLMVDQLVGLYDEVIQEYRNAGNNNRDEEGRAAAAYLRQLKIDFATHGAASLRLVERMQRIPLLGGLGIRLARKITGHPD